MNIKLIIAGVVVGVLGLAGVVMYYQQSVIKGQAGEIAEKDISLRLQAGEIVGLKIDKHEATARQDTLNRRNATAERQYRDTIINNNKHRGRLGNALLEKPEMVIDLINNATADRMRQLENATDNPND